MYTHSQEQRKAGSSSRRNGLGQHQRSVPSFSNRRGATVVPGLICRTANLIGRVRRSKPSEAWRFLLSLGARRDRPCLLQGRLRRVVGPLSRGASHLPRFPASRFSFDSARVPPAISAVTGTMFQAARLPRLAPLVSMEGQSSRKVSAEISSRGRRSLHWLQASDRTPCRSFFSSHRSERLCETLIGAIAFPVHDKSRTGSA